MRRDGNRGRSVRSRVGSRSLLMCLLALLSVSTVGALNSPMPQDTTDVVDGLFETDVFPVPEPGLRDDDDHLLEDPFREVEDPSTSVQLEDWLDP